MTTTLNTMTTTQVKRTKETTMTVKDLCDGTLCTFTEIPVGSEGDFTLNLVSSRGDWRIYVADQAHLGPNQASDDPSDYVRILYSEGLNPLRVLLRELNDLEEEECRVTEDYEAQTQALQLLASRMASAVEQLISSELPDFSSSLRPLLTGAGLSEEEAQGISEHLTDTLWIEE